MNGRKANGTQNIYPEILRRMTDMIQDDTAGYNNKIPSAAEQRELARFRGWTIRILAELEHSGGLSVAQLTEKLNHRRPDVRKYCERLYLAGFIEPLERWGWKITPAGVLLLYIQADDTNTTLTLHKRDTNTTVRQLTLAPYVDPHLGEPELAVTNLLISHYNATKEKFIFVKDQAELAERLSIPPDILRAALANLRQDGVCYLWYDRQYGMYQLRLKPAFLERMQHV